MKHIKISLLILFAGLFLLSALHPPLEAATARTIDMDFSYVPPGG
jgi:hypothetical protein